MCCTRSSWATWSEGVCIGLSSWGFLHILPLLADPAVQRSRYPPTSYHQSKCLRPEAHSFGALGSCGRPSFNPRPLREGSATDTIATAVAEAADAAEEEVDAGDVDAAEAAAEVQALAVLVV